MAVSLDMEDSYRETRNPCMHLLAKGEILTWLRVQESTTPGLYLYSSSEPYYGLQNLWC